MVFAIGAEHAFDVTVKGGLQWYWTGFPKIREAAAIQIPKANTSRRIPVKTAMVADK
jgi:hypothetical protein